MTATTVVVSTRASYLRPAMWAFASGLVAVFCMSIALPSVMAASNIPSPAPKIVASIPYWDQDRAVQSFRRNVASIDFISLFWYSVSRGARIVRYRDADVDRSIIAFAHQNGVKVFLLVANLPDETGTTWDWQRIDPIMQDRLVRKRFIAQALQLAQELDADGITIDFESVRERQRTPFSRFVSELAAALHERGKLLRVSVERRSANAYTNGKDWRAIAAVADQLAIMSYDEHAEESQPGPVASLPWVAQTLRFARSINVPMKKMSLGISLEGYDWPQRNDGRFDAGEGVRYVDVRRRQLRYHAESLFDQRAHSPFLRYVRDGRRRVIWYENQSSFRSKLRLANDYGVGSIFVWRLGGEDQRIWSQLAASR